MLKIIYTDSDKSGTNRNFYYLLWFQPSLWIIIYSKNKVHIFLDWRYIGKKDSIDIEKLKERLWNNDLEINFIKLTKEYIKDIKDICKKHKKIWLEKTIPYFFYEEIKNTLKDTKFIFKDNAFSKQRIIKDLEEIKYIKKAINIIDKVYLEIEKLNKTWKIIWKTELELRSFIIQKIFEFWGEWESFETIVAFWINSAIPHHTTWNTKIWNGPLLIDMWALYKWYASDFTRTFWVWTIPKNKFNKNFKLYKEFIDIYEIVKLSYIEALKTANIWTKTKDIDITARKVITYAWYGEYFSHSTWHGIWLDVHELPSVNKNSKEKIKSWFVFTIEPWIYLPKKFWIRLENIVICDKKWWKSYSKVKI